MTDSVGAVVQGQGLGQEPGSNAVRSATSSGTGAYSIPTLAPGMYDVTVKVASFKNSHVSDLPLTVGQLLSLNVQLEPGAVTKKLRCELIRSPTLILNLPR